MTGGIDVAVATKDSDRKGAVIYLDKGKTIKIPFDKSDTNIIYWHYNPDASAASSNAQLMLTNIYMDGTTKKSKSACRSNQLSVNHRIIRRKHGFFVRFFELTEMI